MPDKIVELFNFKFSVYGRIVKIILDEKGIPFNTHSVNPFADNLASGYLAIHPFKRVPAIRHGEFILYETSAITQYLDEAFDGPAMQPGVVAERAKMRQVISIIDSYGYIPLVRKVFSESVFNPAFNERTDEDILRKGLRESARVLDVLERILQTDEYFAANSYSLADAHVIPMIDYFTMAPEGATIFLKYANLTRWWNRVKERPSTLSTRPNLPGYE